MKYWLSAGILLLSFTYLPGQYSVAESLTNNVVAISTSFDDGHKEYGFGFVTGTRGQSLYIVTAAHVVSDADEYSTTQSIKLQFESELGSFDATLVRKNTNYDVALLEVPKPPNYRWQQNCLAIPGIGQRVAFIGRERRWYIPPAPVQGAISEIRDNQLSVDIISIRPGTSGAPLVNEQGIIGLIIADEGSTAEAIDIEYVRDLITDFGRYSYVFTLTGAGISLQNDSDFSDAELERAQRELNEWLKIKNSQNIEDFRQFLKKYPGGNFSRQANEKVKAIEQERLQSQENLFWQIAVEQNTVDALENFKARFPNSQRIARANEMIKDLQKEDAKVEDGLLEIKGGTFNMGCTSEQGSDCYDGEKPMHSVKVPTFYIGKFEVTKGEYVEFLNSNSNQITLNDKDVSLGGNPIFELSTYSKVTYKNGTFSVENGYERHPANEVSWYGAVEYCNWLSRQSKLTPFYNIRGESVTFNANSKGYRLPSEAEWEFAARGGNQSRGYKYAGGNDIDKVAWYGSNSGSETHEVGKKQANELGLSDMSGNVWEWTNDCWNDTYSGAPSEGSAWRNGDCSRFVLRGGGCYYLTRYCRVSLRLNLIPPPRDDGIGFRLARAH